MAAIMLSNWRLSKKQHKISKKDLRERFSDYTLG